ncbi:hypothetical protein B0H34DRAFT_692893 [Crassisporium funariophilum]|nr:hypothetical protein B0H34DRAFT_692893 [Crassisporium funariophilum]
MTVLVHMMFNKWSWHEGKFRGGAEHDRTLSYIVASAEHDRTRSYIVASYPKTKEENPHLAENPRYSKVFYNYRTILDECYHAAFSASSDMDDLIKSLPGILVQRLEMPLQGIADVFAVDLHLAKDLLDRNRQFIGIFKPAPGHFALNVLVSEYLRDASRCGMHYHDPLLHHIAICRRYLSVLFNCHWSEHANSNLWFRRYNLNHFCEHLRNADVELSEEMLEDHPVMGLINYLDTTVYFSLETWGAPRDTLLLMWNIVKIILRWVRDQQERLDASDSEHKKAVKGRLFRITGRIYQQILYMQHSDNQTAITLRAPLADIVRRSKYTRPETPHLESIPMAPPGSKPTVISDVFFFCEGQLLFVAEFLTDPERAGELYINADVYHTQLAEAWLDRCVNAQESSFQRLRSSDCHPGRACYPRLHWEFHLVQALPSEKIFAMLRIAHTSSLFGASDPYIESFKTIIAWLESLPAPPLDVYLRWQKELLEQEAIEWSSSMVKVTPKGRQVCPESSNFPPIYPCPQWIRFWFLHPTVRIRHSLAQAKGVWSQLLLYIYVNFISHF